MQAILQAVADNLLALVAIVGITVYAVTAVRQQPNPHEKYDAIERLHRLKEQGAITQDEFEAKKAELLE